ncbi:GTPase [Candidatus Electrothrix gigas]
MEKNENTVQLDRKLDKIIKNHTLSAIGVGLIPAPAVDFAGLLVIQSNMIREIAKLYNVPFIKEAAKNALTSLIGSAFLANAMPIFSSMIKVIPVIGQTIGMVTMPISCGASTYATGKVFIRHFESGGDLVCFDSEKMKAYYKEMLKEGKRVAQKIFETEYDKKGVNNAGK